MNKIIKNTMLFAIFAGSFLLGKLFGLLGVAVSFLLLGAAYYFLEVRK